MTNDQPCRGFARDSAARPRTGAASWRSSRGSTTPAHGPASRPASIPAIRSLAIHTNDYLPDDERQKLLGLIPRMIGTNTGGEALTHKLLGWLARQVLPVYERWAREAGYDDGGAVRRCIEEAERGRAAEAAWAVRAAEAAEAPLDLLTGLLDRYDELTGRGEAEAVDFAPVCEAMGR